MARSHVTIDPGVWTRVRMLAFERKVPAVRLLDHLVQLGLTTMTETLASPPVHEQDAQAARDVEGDSPKAPRTRRPKPGDSPIEHLKNRTPTAAQVEAAVTATRDQWIKDGLETPDGLGVFDATALGPDQEKGVTATVFGDPTFSRYICISGTTWDDEETHDRECTAHDIDSVTRPDGVVVHLNHDDPASDLYVGPKVVNTPADAAAAAAKLPAFRPVPKPSARRKR